MYNTNNFNLADLTELYFAYQPLEHFLSDLEIYPHTTMLYDYEAHQFCSDFEDFSDTQLETRALILND